MSYDTRNHKCGSVSGVFFTGVKPAVQPKSPGHLRKVIPGAPSIHKASTNFLGFLKTHMTPFELGALVAHNGARFDVPFLIKSMERAGLDGLAELQKAGVSHQVDTLEMVRQHKTHFKNHRLGTVYKTLTGKPLKNAHHALVDSEAMMPIVNHDLFGEMLASRMKII